MLRYVVQATTPALFGDMKREIRARQDGGWRSVRWKMLKRPRLNQIQIVHGRIMAQNPKVSTSHPHYLMLHSDLVLVQLVHMSLHLY